MKVSLALYRDERGGASRNLDFYMGFESRRSIPREAGTVPFSHFLRGIFSTFHLRHEGENFCPPLDESSVLIVPFPYINSNPTNFIIEL